MKNSCRGITLIELVVVVAIVGILASVAIPAYRNQTLRSNRTSAKVALQQTAQTLERCYTSNRSYVGCAGVLASNPTPDGLYTVGVVATQTTYTLTAAPVAGKGQTADEDCASLTLNQTGQRGSSPSGVDVCWQK